MSVRIIMAIGFATAALVRFAHRSQQAVSAHTGNGQLSRVEPDRAMRSEMKAMSLKGLGR